MLILFLLHVNIVPRVVGHYCTVVEVGYNIKNEKKYKLDCYLFVLQLYLHYTYISKADDLSKLKAAGSCIIAAGICFLLGVPKWLIDRSTDDWAMNFGEGPKTPHLMNNLYLREWRGCRGSMRSLLLSRVLCPP